MEEIEIGCTGGCKKTTKDPVQSGWNLQEITGRWRCGQCIRELWVVSTLEGKPPRADDRLDPLPKDSIGALKELPKREPLKERVVK